MKTTITLPDPYHKKLKKIAIDQSTTLGDLIREAVRHRFFQSMDEGVLLPLNQMEGCLSQFSSSENDLKELKTIWHKSRS